MELYSATKGITSAAAGIAVGEGLFNLDDKIYTFFPEYSDRMSENAKKVTVYDLLHMKSGLDAWAIGFDSPLRKQVKDWAEWFFTYDLKEPGKDYVYASINTHMVVCVIEKASGMDFLQWIMPRLFEPLGIYYPDWLRTPTGTPMGGYGLRLSIDEMGRFGQMILDDGMYDGKQIVPREYVEKLWTTHISMPNEFQSLQITLDQDLFYTYSYFYCSNTDTLIMAGYMDQYVLISRKKNAVVSVLSYTTDDILKDVWADVVEVL